MTFRAPLRYWLALLAWLVASVAMLGVWPLALVALLAPALAHALIEAGLTVLRAPQALACAALASLALASWLCRGLPDAGARAWARRSARIKAQVRTLRSDAAGLTALVLAWAGFRAWGIAAWRAHGWPASLGESLEYLLAMGVAAGWVLVALGALARLWRFARAR